MIFVFQRVKNYHSTAVQWREPHLQIFFGCWVIPHMNLVAESSIANSVALEPITFVLVCDPYFVSVVPLESHCHLVSSKCMSGCSYFQAQVVYPGYNWFQLLIRVPILAWCSNTWILVC